MAPQTITPSVDTSGTAGTRNARGNSGRRLRKIHTPMHTSTNANKVPMLVISPTISSGRNAANRPVKTKNSAFDLYGVESRMNLGEDLGDQAVLAHGIKHARLAEQHHQDHRRKPRQNSDCN